MLKRLLKKAEIPLLILVPLVLMTCAIFSIANSALLTLFVVVLALVVFLARFELSKPSLQDILPPVVLGSFAAAGRILFAAIPDCKPVSAVCILAGVIFGRHTGFLVGALGAFVSNFFFGQGPWTPWQMYAWAMIGYGAGFLQEKGFFDRGPILYLYGFFSGIAYGFLLNTWHIVGFVHPLTWESAFIAYAASLAFDVGHGLSTLAFLLIIYAPWKKKLMRLKKKYELL